MERGAAGFVLSVYDDGDFWPVGFAIGAWSPSIGKKVAELVATAAS